MINNQWNGTKEKKRPQNNERVFVNYRNPFTRQSSYDVAEYSIITKGMHIINCNLINVKQNIETWFVNNMCLTTENIIAWMYIPDNTERNKEQ